MSILPSQNIGSTSSSSSQFQSQNPNPNHGPLSHTQLSESPSSVSHQAQILQSLQISSSESPDHRSGSMASASESSSRSSQKVDGLVRRSGKKSLAHQNGSTNSPHEASRQASFAPSHHSGKSAGMSTYPSSQQTSRSTNSHGITTHSGGKKTQIVNGNHLLNFHYDPISRPLPRAPPPRRQQKRKPYNKDLFLQANYKFVVLDTGNHAPPETMDPDKMLQWEDIICVKYSSPFFVQCPICMEEPLCPQITSCGHIFCFACILQYLLMGKDDHRGECWKKCPLCFMMISSKDLYTIYIEKVKQYSIGDTIEFMLLTRRKDSFTISLKNNQELDDNEEANDTFSKFTFTLDVDLSVRKAMSDLDGWLARADSGLVDDLEKLPYICAAMEQLEQRKKYWNEHRACVVYQTSENDDYHSSSYGSPTASPTYSKHGPDELWFGTLVTSFSNNAKCLRNSTSEDGETCLDQTTDIVESSEDQNSLLSSSYDDIKNIQRHSDGLKDIKDKDSYTFYQVLDGQHLILHPLNMRCLLFHYGSYDRLPNRISGKIVQMETVTQSEAMRQRFRFLSHFSLTTTFQFCEVDLSAVLPLDSLSPFIDEIKNREKQRKRVARKEQNQKIKAEAVAMYFTPVPYELPLSFHDDSPIFSMDDFKALGSSTVTSSTPPTSSIPTVGDKQSFSSVARLGFAAGHDSPALKFEEAHSLSKTSASGSRNGTPSFANVISRAKPVESPDTSRTNEMGKKGKKPSRVLLSTAGGRRY